MTSFKIIILTSIQIIIVRSSYVESEGDFQKPRLERNNIVNKGIWIRNKVKENYDKGRAGEFIFRENSLDVDNLLQNHFDAFGENGMQDSPFISYIERQKRSSHYLRNKRHRKNRTTANTKMIDFESGDIAKSKLINELKPSSFFNDYPYEVAILLNNDKIKKERTNRQEKDEGTLLTAANTNMSEHTTISMDTEFKTTFNDSTYNVTLPKRSMQYDFESDADKKVEYIEVINKTNSNLNYNDNKVNDRNVFDKDNSEWQQSAPLPVNNMYKVVPQEPERIKSKPVTERGLIKVISMLTKTFKKIMRQHGEIKDIHTRITEMSEDLNKNSGTIASKLQDFDLKYLYILKFHDRLKDIETKLKAKEEYFNAKDKEMSRNFKDFESQQKKFLQQQKQFYNIQKLMLAQNEKINLKQNLIAKTQGEISHRQNNFARILKKAKQLYIDTKNSAITKLSSSITKAKEPVKYSETKPPPTSARPIELTTDSIKINLFSIPTSNKLQEDPDELILKEKDDQAIDDLVYKYYFNNTFIDSIMRSKVLNSFMVNNENINSRNVKTKRNELETTLLLPVIDINETGHENTRERRWINHHSRRKNRRWTRGKAILGTSVNTTDEKRSKNTPVDRHMPDIMPLSDPLNENSLKRDPFLIMATSFCNEIRKNSNQQVLRWCIEKALRRLQFLARIIPVKPPTSPRTPEPEATTGALDHSSVNQQPALNLNMIPLVTDKAERYDVTQTAPEIPSTAATVSKSTVKEPVKLTSPTLITTDIVYANLQPHTVVPQNSLHFPDNEELESNLKQFDITPDTEGNVYYEGSFHMSDLGKIVDSESQGVDDIIPGLESNSRVEVDPLTFDLQAKRRAFVRKLNERIKKSLG